ncbi:L-amino acid N-acyltransferase YncA [Anaerobacterium chartisolvens]|uniref:L-amino acid N-acyltransferase YncA n=1 Tax=Anaerobacterium chartisolvens TaxID=1297424 RepID=A0A369BHS0_9FIRM|nr:GNAT family N-acetyltransferase [Anaerobacterium chartisolvens]RCX20118.1 L-amino acid N-acyltransferase YncA [Anaerobacterium chartisolvens]
MDNLTDTRADGFKLRFAEEADVSLILEFIKELAEYENLLDQVKATQETLRESIFKRRVAEVVIAEYENRPVGYVLFFHNFSTFEGLPGIYIEDLYVRPELRGKGLGKLLLSFMAELAVERNCARLEWACLDWNEPSISFYKKMGAAAMDEWTVYRVSGRALNDLANRYI